MVAAGTEAKKVAEGAATTAAPTALARGQATAGATNNKPKSGRMAVVVAATAAAVAATAAAVTATTAVAETKAVAMAARQRQRRRPMWR